VLAGGEGTRLRPVTRHLYGEERPKQYAALLGDRSLLRQTLDRVAPLVDPSRTVVVTMEHHARYLAADLGGGGQRPRILAQPSDRGTAAAVLLAAHFILAQDAEATVALFPSDHLILEEAAFIAHVQAVTRFVAGRPDWTVLLGAPPREPEPDYGWVERGELVGGPAEERVWSVRRFQEKPSPAEAHALLAAGALWNTFVFVARASTLVEAGRDCVPSLHDRLRQAVGFSGTEHERWALRQAYALAPTASFSAVVLEAWPFPLGVSELRGITWCDLGSVERLHKTAVMLGATPPWAATLLPTA
jgi:mannose-1-phosphate guanylyltransferase